MQNNSFNWSLIVSVGALILAALSAFFSYQANAHTKKEANKNFRNTLSDKIRMAKHDILDLDCRVVYTGMQKISIVERIRDLLLYQGYTEEKKSFLNIEQQNQLSELQENIEDYLELILSSTDVNNNKEQAIGALNHYLELI
jgi:hypothetical protein